MFKRQKDYQKYYDAYYYPLYRYAIRQIHNTQDAEDLCQEVFIVFMKKYQAIHDKKNWLYGAMRLHILQYRRTQKKVSNRELEINITDMHLESGDTDTYDIRLILAEALSDEKELEKSIYELKSAYNWTYKQLSDHFKLTVHQVRYVHRKMTDRILQFFKQKGIKDFEDVI